jgi:hypothetical protein
VAGCGGAGDGACGGVRELSGARRLRWPLNLLAATYVHGITFAQQEESGECGAPSTFLLARASSQCPSVGGWKYLPSVPSWCALCLSQSIRQFRHAPQPRPIASLSTDAGTGCPSSSVSTSIRRIHLPSSSK